MSELARVRSVDELVEGVAGSGAYLVKPFGHRERVNAIDNVFLSHEALSEKIGTQRSAPPIAPSQKTSTLIRWRSTLRSSVFARLLSIQNSPNLICKNRFGFCLKS